METKSNSFLEVKKSGLLLAAGVAVRTAALLFHCAHHSDDRLPMMNKTFELEKAVR